MNPAVAPRRNITVCFAGGVFFALFVPFVWTVATIVTAEQATDRLQDELIGYAMIITIPVSAVLAAIAGFLVGFFGDPRRWLLRWAALGAVSVVLAVGFNVWMFRTTGPDSRPHRGAPANVAPVAAPSSKL